MRQYLIRIFKFSIKHWFGMLLTFAGTTVGGWLLFLYRAYLKDWLLSTRYVEMPGWMWVISLLIVGALTVFIFWLWKMRRRVLYRQDGEILIVLEDKLRDLESQKKTQIRIDFRIWDKKLSLAKGKAQKLLPQVVEKDKTWKIIERVAIP